MLCSFQETSPTACLTSRLLQRRGRGFLNPLGQLSPLSLPRCLCGAGLRAPRSSEKGGLGFFQGCAGAVPLSDAGCRCPQAPFAPTISRVWSTSPTSPQHGGEALNDTEIQHLQLLLAASRLRVLCLGPLVSFNCFRKLCVRRRLGSRACDIRGLRCWWLVMETLMPHLMLGGKSLSGNGSRRRMFYSDGGEPGRERSSAAPGTCSTSSRRGGEVAETREQGERLNVASGTQHSTDKPHAR